MPYKDEEQQKTANKKWREESPTFRESQARRRLERREVIAQIKRERGCMFCGEREPICLDFHHRDRSTKIANVSMLVVMKAAYSRIHEEIAKCDVLCANCHRKVEAGLLSFDPDD